MIIREPLAVYCSPKRAGMEIADVDEELFDLLFREMLEMLERV
jgi:hypothetical protein